MMIKQIFKRSSLSRAETRDLLCHVLKRDPAFLLAHPEYKLTKQQANKLTKLLKLRSSSYPLAYLLQSQPFGGLSFFVDCRVLVPRPETELLVTETINIVARSPAFITVADIGTGSGNIAISLAHHFCHVPHQLHIIATDIDKKMLAVAKKNAKLNAVDRHITFLKGNLLKPVFKHVPHPKQLLIVANLPYLSDELYRANPELAFEPKISLSGGKDGLNCYRELLGQLKKWCSRNSPQPPLNLRRGEGERSLSLLMEISPEQSTTITKLIRRHFPKAKVQIKKDPAGRDRCVVFLVNQA